MVKRINKGKQRIIILTFLLVLLCVMLLVLVKMLNGIRQKNVDSGNKVAESSSEYQTSEENSSEENTSEEHTTEEVTAPVETESATEEEKKLTLEDIMKYSDEMVHYGIANDVDAKNRPNGCQWYINRFSDFDVDFIKEDNNKIYLTYMVKKENGNTTQILDILKSNDVSAVFFITYDYVTSNPEIVKRMIDEGHIVGQSSYLSGTIEENLEKEIMAHEYVLDKFGYDMCLFKILNDSFSEQQLAMIESLGYRTVFWSFSYNDWENNQPDVATSLNRLLDKAHSGEILMLRTSSSTSLALLQDLLDGLKEKGFEMGRYE